jgi:gliding motility-associated-like protein
MNKLIFFLAFLLYSLMAKSQILLDNNPPFNTATYLVDNVLLGGGIVGSSHSFIGDPNQIGFFNGVNSNLAIDSGVVLSSGNILELIGPNSSGSTSTPFSGAGDPTLDLVVGPIDYTNDAAVLEFDFVPTSDVISFKYVFGSEEYLEFVTSFNDAFGFFLSGPNPSGGNYVDQNLAIVPGTTNTPVSIFNVNNISNSTYYVDNGTGATAPQNSDPTVIQFDGFTTPLTATAAVNCGDTYHIKIVVADVNDFAYDSGVFLEAGSFYSPPLSIIDDLGIDSTIMNIPCNSIVTLTASGGLGATYQWFDSTSLVISTSSSITVGEGMYVVSADISGCAVLSDTLIVIEGDFPTVDLGVDTVIACNSSYLLIPSVSGGTAPYDYSWSNGSTLSSQNLDQGNYNLIVSDLFGCGDTSSISITYDPPPVVDLGSDYAIACNTITTLIPNVIGGTQPYTYSWSDGSINSSLAISEGSYSITVSDFYACSDSDDIEVTQEGPGTVILSGGGIICEDKSTEVYFNFDGSVPWNLEFTNGLSSQTIEGITESNYSLTTSNNGIYDVVVAYDFNDCLANIVGSAQVIVNPLPVVTLTPAESFIYEGETIELEVGDYEIYQWYNSDGFDLGNFNKLTVSDSGTFYVEVKDFNGCDGVSNFAIVNTQPQTNLFIPNTFTPNGDDHNELFSIIGDNIKTFSIQIFNRWGELMFLSKSIDKSWDGTFKNKKVQEGTYYYNVKVLGDDNINVDLSGSLNIIY